MLIQMISEPLNMFVNNYSLEGILGKLLSNWLENINFNHLIAGMIILYTWYALIIWTKS